MGPKATGRPRGWEEARVRDGKLKKSGFISSGFSPPPPPPPNSGGAGHGQTVGNADESFITRGRIGYLHRAWDRGPHTAALETQPFGLVTFSMFGSGMYGLWGALEQGHNTHSAGDRFVSGVPHPCFGSAPARFPRKPLGLSWALPTP